MFGLFKKKEKVKQPDYEVFLSEVAKYRNLINSINETDEPHYLLFHFDNTGSELQQLLNAAKVPFAVSSGSDNKIILARSSDFLNEEVRPLLKVIVAEIYPLPGIDSEIQAFATGKNFSVRFLTAIDSPFFNLFGDGQLPGLMERLGFDPNETIKHPAVTKSIFKAQQKLAKKVVAEVNERSSIEAWMTSNVSSR